MSEVIPLKSGGSYEPPHFLIFGSMRKKVLIMNWNSVNDNSCVIEVFRKMGMECSMVDLNGQDCREGYHAEFFEEYLNKNKYDLVYSTNYFDYLAVNCHRYGIPYIAWTYDSPARLDEVDNLRYDTTNVFLFDSYEVEKYRDRHNLKNIHYLPLAADIDRFEKAIANGKDKEKYESDISFVGTLYDSELSNYLSNLSDYNKGFFNGVVDFCTGKYDECIIESINAADLFYWKDETAFNDCVINDKKNGRLELGDDAAGSISARVARLAANSITNRERLILISMLSNHWQFKLYSTSSHEVFKTTIECGGVDYYTDMPKVFRYSRINLNITNKGIKAGMPLRCLDIMGSGGLLLSNYQCDFDEHFKDGENILIYHTLDEAYDKCDYYLSHEDERKRIAIKGYETVKEYYNYQTLLTRALKLAGLEYLIK